jgi:nicotinamide-nucleotide amidase
VNPSFYALSQQIGERLLSKGWQVSTAESCTGGWLARCITDVPGSSQWFESGFVTYSNGAKQRQLNVPMRYFTAPDAPGAVSAETVTAMAEGSLAASGAQFAVATSGIAGPGGGSVEKPVGTVWIAWAWSIGQVNADCIAQVQLFKGDREAVRQQTVEAALRGLVQVLDKQLVVAEGLSV